MLRVLFFFLIVFVIGFGFSILAEEPGKLTLEIFEQEITLSLLVAGVILLAAIVAVMLVWWLIKVIFTSPQRVSRFFRARRRDRGYQSLSTGMIAAGAGDSVAARKMLKQANGLLDSTTEPLLKLLDAQATMLEGKHDDARSMFEKMLEDPETRILGLRGLYMEAQRLGDRDAQKHYAEKAAELAPQLNWASRAALDLKTVNGDWDGAIRLLDKQKSTKLVTKEEAKRKRAVLLTAMAMDYAAGDPAKAKSAALEAHKLAPDFVPAAVAAAEAAFRLNEVRRGTKVLETAWRKEPHPDLALAYVNAKPGDTAQERFKRAKRLQTLQPDNNETHMIVGQIALEAGEYAQAREAVAQVLSLEPRESAFMLMADIEAAETGDQGKMREWLARAVRAPRDAAWTADGYVSEKWAPFSPVTGKIDAFEWKVPVERLGGAMIDNDLEPMDPLKPGNTPSSNEELATAVVAAAPEVEDEVEIVDAETVEIVDASNADDTNAASEEETTNKAADSKESGRDPIPDSDSAQDVTLNDTDEDEDIKAPIPDDPGVREGDEPKQDKRFRLF